MFNRVRSLIGKELIQFSRDKLLLIATLLGPVVQFVMVGGSTGGLTGLPVAVVDRDNSEISREVVAALDNTQELAIKFYPPDLEQAEYMLDNGRASGVVVIPERFGEQVRAGEVPQVHLVIDGSNVVTAADALSAAQGAIMAQGYQVQLASAGEGLSLPAGSVRDVNFATETGP